MPNIQLRSFLIAFSSQNDINNKLENNCNSSEIQVYYAIFYKKNRLTMGTQQTKLYASRGRMMMPASSNSCSETLSIE